MASSALAETAVPSHADLNHEHLFLNNGIHLMTIRMLTSLTLALLLAAPAIAHESKTAPTPGNGISPKAQPAVKVIEQFSKALASGDVALAGIYLAEDVLVLESGGAERSREEYLGGHANHDAEFLKTAKVKVLSRTARVDGNFAWVGSESEVQTNNGQGASQLSTETMVLKQTAKGWQIVHIHWSSRPKR